MNQKRKRPQRPVSGWVIFDKPYGMGSTDAVSFIKRTYRADKAGHAGTLDPLASGILPIALGEATKTVPYVVDGAKVYRFTASWGGERSTDDREGPVTATSDKRPAKADIQALLPMDSTSTATKWRKSHGPHRSRWIPTLRRTGRHMPSFLSTTAILTIQGSTKTTC